MAGNAKAGGAWFMIAFVLGGLILLMGVVTQSHLPTPFPIYDDKNHVHLGLARPLDAMVHLTERLGHFTSEGVVVETRHFPTGKMVMEALLEGEIDMGVVGLGPIAFTAFERQDFKIIASLSTYYDLYKIVARRDAGIRTAEDLKGKRIATTGESSLHFFLHNFLTANYIPTEETQVVFVENLRQFPDLLQRKEVDAIVAREPIVHFAMSLLGENGILLEDPDLPANTFNLVVRNAYLENNSALMRPFMQALARTATTFETPPEKMRTLLQQVNADVEGEKEISGRPEHLLTLDQDLLLRLEAIARWSIRKGKVQDQKLPNFMNVIQPRYLMEVRPTAVTLIH